MLVQTTVNAKPAEKKASKTEGTLQVREFIKYKDWKKHRPKKHWEHKQEHEEHKEYEEYRRHRTDVWKQKPKTNKTQVQQMC